MTKPSSYSTNTMVIFLIYSMFFLIYSMSKWINTSFRALTQC
ncbi:hypothetical protein Gotur_033568 [Gossypium turneri]